MVRFGVAHLDWFWSIFNRILLIPSLAHLHITFKGGPSSVPSICHSSCQTGIVLRLSVSPANKSLYIAEYVTTIFLEGTP